VSLSTSVEKHYQALWGVPARVAEFAAGTKTVRVLKWSPEQNHEGVALYTTAGVSEFAIGPLAPEHRVELFLGFAPEEDRIAPSLALLALTSEFANPHLLPGHFVRMQEPLWDSTELSGFVVLTPKQPIIPELADGTIHVTFLQAIPLFASEMDYAARSGTFESVMALWRERQHPFWDPYRGALPSSGA
jgi:hypothetical protein